jgi:hypothetical protein
MVPSRSRKTAGRKAFASGKALAPNARSFGAVASRQPRRQKRLGGFKHALDGNARHATMIDGTFAKKAGAALHRLPNQRELWGHGPSAFGIAGAEYADHRNSDGAGDVHRSGIIAYK